jgi:hypothetical protein
MAQIQIPGVGSVEVPDFATEYTLNQLLSVLSSQEAERINGLSQIDSSINQEANILRSSLSEMQDTASNTGASRRSQDQANKNSLSTLQQMKKQHKDLVSASTKQTSILPRQTAQILRTAASMVGGKGIGDALSMMPGNLGQGIALATKVVGEFADSQRRLTDVGIGLGTSIMTTTDAIAGFNLPLSELERVAGTHGVTLNWLNEVTTESVKGMKTWTDQGVKPGVVAFAALSNSVRKSMQNFGNFGFTVTEVDSYLAEYLESDRKRGISADTSTSNLTMKFGSLAMEVSAYAADTGRNRKDLMKSQLDNMNRTDASTYSMMLRMKGEDKAAETFEKNLQLITNEMKSRYGDNADAMIDSWIVAQTQGRGLEATAEGAEFMAMLGPAGAVFDQMARSGEAIDPATFKLFDDKLKESVGAYDTQNYALLAKQKESLNMAANMIMYGRDTSETNRELWKKTADQGATLLKANEAMVTVTTNLQKGLVSVTESLVGPKGSLSGELEKALRSVGQFSEAIGMFAKGNSGDAAAAVYEMVTENPWQFLLGTAGMTTGLLGMLGIGAGLSAVKTMTGTQKDDLAIKLAAENVKGGKAEGGKWISKTGTESAITKGKFISEGVEYQMQKDGTAKATKAGMKAVTGGAGGRAMRNVKGGGVGGLFSLAVAAIEGYQTYGAENERYDKLGGDAKATPEQKKQHEQILERIFENVLAKGGGGALGGAVMGTLTGMLTGNPILAILGGLAGTYGGYAIGDKLTDPEDMKSFLQQTNTESAKVNSMSAEEMKTRYVQAKKEEQEKATPSYAILKKINEAQVAQQETLDIIAGGTSQAAVVLKSSEQGGPSNRNPHTR